MSDLKSLSAAATQGSWDYRPLEHDDWGLIRSPEVDFGWEWKPRPIIARFCYGVDDEETLNRHRREKTDPYKNDAVFTCAVVNAYRAGEVVDSAILLKTAVRLKAAISLLEGGGKEAAGSDKMFEQMLLDYKKVLAEARAALGFRNDQDQKDEEHA